MTRETKLVLIAAAAVVILGVAAALLTLHPATPHDSTVIFKAVEPVDVMRVVISNEYGSTDISFTGEGYVVDDIPAERVDMDELIDLLTNCGKVSALQEVNASPKDLAIYGLEKPAAQVAVTYKDGSSLTIMLGNIERVSGNFYMRVDGTTAVYLAEAKRFSAFLLPKKSLVEDQITPELALSSPLSALLNVTFSGAQLKQPVTIEAVAAGDPDVVRAALSFGAATHIVRGKGTYELDQTYAVKMLGSLLGITATDIVGYAMTDEEIMAFGFDHPTMQVEFDLRNGRDVPVETFALSVLAKGNAYYMTCNDNGVIYEVAEPAFVHLEYDKLLVRWFLSPLLMDVSEVQVITSGQRYDFVLTGETNAEKQVTCNGKPLDIERFRTLYRLLGSAAHDGSPLQDRTVKGEPLLQLTYRYRDAGKQPDVMALYKGDTRRLWVQVNGVSEIAMREAYLPRVQQALADLWTDKPIETDW